MWLQARAGKEQEHSVSTFGIHSVYCLTYLQFQDGRAEQNTDRKCLHAVAPVLQEKNLMLHDDKSAVLGPERKLSS